MKTKITWFAVGFVVSWLTWSVVSYVRLRPLDLTQMWPSDLVAPIPLLRSAVAREVGGVLVLASSNERNASAFIRATGANYPQVLMDDGNLDGIVASIMVLDGGSQLIWVKDENGDGQFDWYSVSINMSDQNSITLTDGNMDGQFDARVGFFVHRGVDVWIEGKWRQRTSSNEKHYVELDSGTSEVVMADRIWVLKQ